MKALDRGYHLPVMFGLFGLFFAWMVVHDLRTGAIWRGWRYPPTITLAKDPAEFYVFIAFLSLIALIFLGGAVSTLFVLLRRQAQRRRS